MTPDAFRALALALPGVEEGSHMGHADFRANCRIFATLGSPDAGHGMVKLSPDEQAMRVAAAPSVFRPASGAWGREGSTLVTLAAADEGAVRGALAAAHGMATSRPPARPRKR